MALENVMRVDSGHIVTGGGAGGNSVEIDWKDWCELTPEEQETGDWTIVNCPWADGDVSVDLMTKLWENPDPTVMFVEQSITGLTTLKDYKLFLIICRQSTTTNRSVVTLSSDIGTNVFFSYPSTEASQGSCTFRRIFTIYTSENKINIGDCLFGYTGKKGESASSSLIPYQIYGIKTTASVKINVIAMDVSTSADKCMLSDGETSVEDALDELRDIVGKVNRVSLSSAVSIPKNTITTILSLNLTEGTYLINGSYLGFSTEASYFKGMWLMIGDSSTICLDRRIDATSGGGTTTGVVVVPANSTYTIKFKLMHGYTSSLNITYAALNSIKIA